MNFDLVNSVIDEISLEGLSGITLESLWIRLSVRFCSVQSSFDFKSVDVHNFIFENVIKTETTNDTFKMLLLPEKRPILRLYNRYDFMNQETGTLMEDPELIPPDIYGEVVPISDGQIRGSSHDYYNRIDVTQQVLDNNMSINDISAEFGLEKFVLVANQYQRNKALMGTTCDPALELNPIQYCILERIGRQRFLGEITVGKESGIYKASPKTLFYYRKILLRNKLIKKKQCIIYNLRSVQNNHGLVFTLNRFFVERLTPIEMNAKKINELLLDAPNHELDYEELRNQVDVRPKHFRELLANYSANFKVCEIKGEKKVLISKSVQLIKSIEEEDINESLDDGEEGEDDDEEETIDTNKCNSLAKMGCVFNPGKILVDRPLLSQALAIIESHESQEGISMKEIGRCLSLPKLETRSLVRYLEKLGEISSVMIDRGRQKVTIYIPKCKVNDTKNIFNRARKSLAVNESDTVGQLRRANIILDFVKKEKLVDRIFNLKQIIRESESNQLHKVDTKSVIRIVHKLAADGHVRSIRTVLRYQEQVKKLHFVCIPSITADHPLVKEKINQYKFQWIGKYCFDVQSDRQLSQINKEKPSATKENTNNRESLVKNNYVMNLVYQPSIARKYGLEPKLKKILTLYRFLFYLTYDCTKDNVPNIDWRFNIESLPNGTQAKVCTIGEIIPRMPLSIFVKIVWISYVIPGLQELLDDPITMNLTLSQISPSIRQCLLYKRKFAFNICEGLVALSYLGLVETQYKEQLPKETTIITVKNKTSLTNNNKTTNYEFHTLKDFDDFAEALQYHCFGPCDNCCLDQRLFPHNLRNWTYTPSYKLKNMLAPNRLQRISVNNDLVQNNENNKRNSNKRKKNSNSTQNSKKICLKSDIAANEPIAGTSDLENRVEKSSVEVSNNKKSIDKKSKKKKIRTKSYDKIDLRAKRLLKKKRTDWTQEEDAFLLVCKVASGILDPNCPHYICVGRNVVRDQLHKYSPNISKDKTALACQRRINYMLKNPNTRQNISDYIGEFKQQIKDLNINRPNVPKTHEEVWNESFINLLNLILNRMQSPFLNNESETPIRFNSIEDLLSRFNIVKSATNILPVRAPMHQNPNNVVDIHVNVVTNILLSTLLSKHYLNSNNKEENNNYFTQTLFKIYQRYPDSLIRSVVAKLAKYGIMTKLKKKVDLNSLKSRGNTPYRISQNFLFLFQTKFLLENLLTVNDLEEDICIKEGKTSFEAAIVTNLFASKSVKFSTNIPENIVMLSDNCPLTSTVRNSVRNPYDPKCSSRYALHVLRQHMNSMPSDRTQHSQDYLFVNQCKITCSATTPILLNKSNFEQVFNKHKTLSNPQLKGSDIQCPADDKNLLKFIMTKRELGASYDDIRDYCNGIWPKESLRLFDDLKLVYRVGIRSFRWVHVDYVNPWLVHSPIDAESERLGSTKNDTNVQFVKFFARYWKRPDGTIDNKVLFKFLSGVLGHIMTYPCITEQKIIDYFSQSLQPVQLLEILELLEAADCIDIIESPQISKPVLFETRSTYTTDMIKHYISTPNSLIHLCRLRQYLNV